MRTEWIPSGIDFQKAELHITLVTGSFKFGYRVVILTEPYINESDIMRRNVALS